jgi:c-di-GMP-binding flagellar brake protein YcgR
MPELVRSIAGRLRALVGNRRYARRYRARVEASVQLVAPTLAGDALTPPLACHTCDVSATGVGLVVPVVRVGERYLAGEGRLLRVRLELPTGALTLHAAPVRYERLEEPETGYVIGAHFTPLDDDARARLDGFLKTLAR